MAYPSTRWTVWISPANISVANTFATRPNRFACRRERITSGIFLYGYCLPLPFLPLQLRQIKSSNDVFGKQSNLGFMSPMPHEQCTWRMGLITHKCNRGGWHYVWDFVYKWVDISEGLLSFFYKWADGRADASSSLGIQGRSQRRQLPGLTDDADRTYRFAL